MEAARITITTGPQRGKTFPLDRELIHIGKATQNEIVIDDPSLGDHQASIVHRNGRYAIFAPNGRSIELDGSAIPAERWVWLPPRVMILLGGRTTCQFEATAADDSGLDQSLKNHEPATPEFVGAESVEQLPAGEPAAAAVADEAESSQQQPVAKTKRTGKRAGKRNRETARFITDNSGDAMVQLGEDGKLPELTLDEGLDRKGKEPQSNQSNPLLLYAALAVSFVSSLSMLFIDMEPSTSATARLAQARRTIATFYGNDEEELLRYQELLREARLAYSRSDASSERDALRQVLELLNSEDKNQYTGLTGKNSRDTELKRLIGTLLGAPSP